MVNWNTSGIRKGMLIAANMRVTKVTERNGIRSVHLVATDLPNGVEVDKFVLKVRADTQDVTLAEANQQPPA